MKASLLKHLRTRVRLPPPPPYSNEKAPMILGLFVFAGLDFSLSRLFPAPSFYSRRTDLSPAGFIFAYLLVVLALVCPRNS